MTKYILKQDGAYESVIEKSRFICHALRVTSKEEAYERIKEFKKTYWEATHNCSAFIIGEDQMIQGSSDDGEPSGTAGIPMLEVLKKRELHDVLVVVTRYFGGIKLGAGGLVRAYSKSVSATLDQLGTVQKVAMLKCCLSAEPSSVGRTLNILYQQSLFRIVEVEYAAAVKIILLFPKEQLQAVQQLLADLLQQHIELEELAELYDEVDC